MSHIILRLYYSLLVVPMLRHVARTTRTSADAYIGIMWDLETLPKRSRRLCKQRIHKEMGWI